MFLHYANGTKSRKASNILKTSNQSKLIYIINNHAPVYFFFKKISTKLQSKKNGRYKRYMKFFVKTNRTFDFSLTLQSVSKRTC